MHGGGLPGFTTSVSLLPNENSGLVLLMNADGKVPVISVITERIFQAITGEDAADEHSALKSLKQPFSQKFPTSAVDPPPELHVYSGEYSNPGYGSFTLCDPRDASDYCTQVLADFAAVDNATSRPEITSPSTLYAAWPRIWSSHVRLVHLFNHTFALEVTKLFPDGYGRNRDPFAAGTAIGGVAEFVMKNGKAIGLGFKGEDTNGQRPGFTVQERADVWFDKMA
jgi:hypothetical protein